MLKKNRETTPIDAEKAIIDTLSYSDLFAFPLSEKELWYFLKSKKPIAKITFSQAIKHLLQEKKIYKNIFFVLSGRESLINLRKKRQQISQNKLLLAKKMSNYLQCIPSVLCIGISGSLASHNAEEKDDIDFFLIVSDKTIWITRLLVLGIIEISGKRRRKTDTETENKYCVNMIMTDNALTFSPKRQDIYTAHEIAQLLPLKNKQHTYERLLAENKWLQQYLPNVPIPPVQKKKNSWLKLGWLLLFRFCDPIAQVIQIRSIKNTQTTETITNNILAFHPEDHRLKVLKIIKKKLM